MKTEEINFMENKILTTNFHTHTTRCNHAVGEDRQYV